MKPLAAYLFKLGGSVSRSYYNVGYLETWYNVIREVPAVVIAVPVSVGVVVVVAVIIKTHQHQLLQKQ